MPLRAAGILLPAVAVLAAAVLALGLIAGFAFRRGAGKADAAPLEVRAVQDTYLSTPHPQTAYGHALMLRMDGPPERALVLLRFALPRPRNEIATARLRVFAESSVPYGFDVARSPWSSWTEAATWRGMPPRTSPAIPVAGTSGGWVDVDVTPLLANSTQVDLVLSTESATMTRLASREHGDRAPRLVLTPLARAAAQQGQEQSHIATFPKGTS